MYYNNVVINISLSARSRAQRDNRILIPNRVRSPRNEVRSVWTTSATTKWKRGYISHELHADYISFYHRFSIEGRITIYLLYFSFASAVRIPLISILNVYVLLSDWFMNNVYQKKSDSTWYSMITVDNEPRILITFWLYITLQIKEKMLLGKEKEKQHFSPANKTVAETAKYNEIHRYVQNLL